MAQLIRPSSRSGRVSDSIQTSQVSSSEFIRSPFSLTNPTDAVRVIYSALTFQCEAARERERELQNTKNARDQKIGDLERQVKTASVSSFDSLSSESVLTGYGRLERRSAHIGWARSTLRSPSLTTSCEKRNLRTLLLFRMPRPCVLLDPTYPVSC